jgi:hypothetical protein
MAGPFFTGWGSSHDLNFWRKLRGIFAKEEKKLDANLIFGKSA